MIKKTLSIYIRKLFSPTILIISIIFLIYIFYKSEIIHESKNKDYYLIYYIIGSLLFFFSILTFFISQKAKEYFLIIFVSLFFSLYFFEGYLVFQSLKEFDLKKNLYEKQTGKKYDDRSRIKFYQDLKDKNINVEFAVMPKILMNNIFVPLSGTSNSLTVGCNENGYYSVYQADRFGFNNSDEDWDSEEIEYLLTGDSYFHGACVNRPDDVTSVLRRLSGKPVLNVAYSSNGPLIYYASLREYLNKKVKKVLWIHTENNHFNNLVLEMKNEILINYLENLEFTQNLKLRQNEVNNLTSNIIEKKIKGEKSDFQKFLTLWNLRKLFFYQTHLEPTPKKEDFKKILELAKKLTIENNSKLYVVYFPEYSRYVKDYDNTNYNLIKNILDEINIPLIDLHKEVFEKEKEPLKLFPFELNGHYNVDGYRKVSETIYRLTKD